MTEDDDIRTQLFDHFLVAYFELVELAEDVTNQNPASGQLFNALVGKGQRGIVVAPDSKNRRDSFQSLNHIELSNITGVNDCIDSGEDARDGLVEEPVRVRYDANPHRTIRAPIKATAARFILTAEYVA